MKRTTAVMAALFLLIAALPCFAGTEAAGPSDEIMQFFENTALPEMKAFMKSPDSEYVGTIFDTEEEIDSLELKEAVPNYCQTGEDLGADQIELVNDCWSFVVSSDIGHSVIFSVYRSGSGELTFRGAQNAKNFLDAEAIMKKLMKKAGTEGEPIFIDNYFYSVLYADFNGDERVMTVPTDAGLLDEAYYSVNDYRELPTVEGYNAALAEERAKPLTDENGQYLYGAGTKILLSPKLSDEYAKKTSPLVWILPVAAAAVIAAVSIFAGKRRAANK